MFFVYLTVAVALAVMAAGTAGEIADYVHGLSDAYPTPIRPEATATRLDSVEAP